MRVMLDISVIGIGQMRTLGRTGIFRVCEHLLAELSNYNEGALLLNAQETALGRKGVVEYLSQRPAMQAKLSRNFISAQGPLDKRLDRVILKCVEMLEFLKAKDRNDGPQIRFYRRLVAALIKRLDKLSREIYIKSFPEFDVYHAPFFTIPSSILSMKRVGSVLTVYDLIPVKFPELFGAGTGQQHRRNLEFLRHKGFAVCISENTKSDLCECIGVPEDRVFTAPLAADPARFYKCDNVDRLQRVRRTYNLHGENPYILSVATIEPRKNIAHTVTAFARLVEQEKIKDIDLVLVGAIGWKTSAVFDAIKMANKRIGKRIYLTGFVDDDDLAALYSGAMTFVYPSLYEGFGLPPLEAMACGLPVITSNNSSLPEVVGDAGVLVDPQDEDGLCQALFDVCNKPDLRTKLALRAIERASMFSWDRFAKQNLNVYRLAASALQ